MQEQKLNSEQKDETQLPSSPNNSNTNVIGSQSPTSFNKEFIYDEELHPKLFEGFDDWSTHYVLFMSDTINRKVQEDFRSLKKSMGLTKSNMILHKGKVGIYYDLSELRSIYTEMSSL